MVQARQHPSVSVDVGLGIVAHRTGGAIHGQGAAMGRESQYSSNDNSGHEGPSSSEAINND